MGDCGDDMLESVCGGKTIGRGKLVIGANCGAAMYILGTTVLAAQPTGNANVGAGGRTANQPFGEKTAVSGPTRA